MAYLQGKDVLFQLYRDDDYLDFLCATDIAINQSTDLKSVKTVGDGQWRKFKPQVIGYDVALNGITPIGMSATNIDAWEIMNLQIQMVEVKWRAIFRDAFTNVVKVRRGDMYPVSSGLTAPVDFIRGAFSFTGTGALIEEDSIPSCDASIGNISFTLPTILASPVLKVNYLGVSLNTMRFDYILDGGGRQTVLSPGTNGYWGLNVGNKTITHTLSVIPICVNGLDGTPYPEQITPTW